MEYPTELGARFLDWYADFAADPAPASLRHHYIANRAFVRAKVACLRHAQGDESAATLATQHADLTVGHLRDGAVALVLVGGLPAAGKSTLAGKLADLLGAVLLSSDPLRKELAGLAPHTPAAARYGQGIYGDAWTERTYTDLVARAGQLLERGESVILDASWTQATYRDMASDAAGRTHSTLVSLLCDAAPDVVAARLRGRANALPDADQRIALEMAARADPWPRRTQSEPTRCPTTPWTEPRTSSAPTGPPRSAQSDTRRRAIKHHSTEPILAMVGLASANRASISVSILHLLVGGCHIHAHS